MEQKNDVDERNKKESPALSNRSNVMARVAIFITSIVFLSMIVVGVYSFIDNDFIIYGNSEYIGGALVIGSFIVPSLLLRYAFKLGPDHVRDVFFDQLALVLAIATIALIVFIPQVISMITYHPWFSGLLVGGGGIMYVISWFLRKRPKFIVGGFLIAIASIVIFFGLMGFLAMKYII